MCPVKPRSSNKQTWKVPFFHCNPYYLLGGWTDPTANYRLVKVSIIVKRFMELKQQTVTMTLSGPGQREKKMLKHQWTVQDVAKEEHN